MVQVFDTAPKTVQISFIDHSYATLATDLWSLCYPKCYSKGIGLLGVKLLENHAYSVQIVYLTGILV